MTSNMKWYNWTEHSKVAVFSPEFKFFISPKVGNSVFPPFKRCIIDSEAACLEENRLFSVSQMDETQCCRLA